MRQERENPIVKKLAPLAALQQLDLGQTASDQAQQQLDQQQQDQAVRQAAEMYGIEHQRALLPGQVQAQDIANQTGQYHLAFDPRMDEQKLRMGEVDINAVPAKTNYMQSQARHTDAETDYYNARLAAGEPAADVAHKLALTENVGLPEAINYATMGQTYPNSGFKVPGLNEKLSAKFLPKGTPQKSAREQELEARDAKWQATLGTGKEVTKPYIGGTSPEHPLASLLIKGMTPDYPALGYGMSVLNPALALNQYFGEDIYNALDKGDNLDLNSILLSKSAKARRQQEKEKAKALATQQPHPSTAFNQ